MTSPSRRRLVRATRLKLVVYTSVFLVVLGSVFMWRDAMAGLLLRVAPPLEAVRSTMGGNLFSVFTSNASLMAELEQARAALASSSVALLDRNLLLAENTELKSRFNRNPQLHSTLATIVMRPPATPYDTLLLDVGEREGIVIGDLVSPGGSVYIGRVSIVYPTTSRVILFSASGESYDALLATPGNSAIPLAVKGQGGGSLVGQVPAGTAVAVGDSIIFPSIGVQFVASVHAIDSREEESFKTLYMQLPVNPLTLRFVEVRHLTP